VFPLEPLSQEAHIFTTWWYISRLWLDKTTNLAWKNSRKPQKKKAGESASEFRFKLETLEI
jgi:hypothetical protein